MADIVDSRLKDQRELMSTFKELVGAINQVYAPALLSPLTITLGDEFQGVVQSAQEAISILIALEEQIVHRRLDFKLRYVILKGEIETDINRNIAYGMLGQGLTDARANLNAMKHTHSRMRIEVGSEKENYMLGNAFEIFQSIVDKWDLKQDYELVSSFLKLKDYKLVAEDLARNRSLMWKREKSLNLSSYYAIKNIIALSIS